MKHFTIPPPAPASRYAEPPRPACADHEDDPLWHPTKADAEYAAAAALRLYCGRCPVYEACLTEALADDVHGTWAGTSYAQRQAMRRKAERAARAAVAGTAR